MLGIQEILVKEDVKAQLHEIERVMDSTASFHPSKASIFNVPSAALRHELQDSYAKIPLQEFLAKSGTAGLEGAAYLVPDKLHSELILSSSLTDIVPIISAQMVTEWKGAETLKVNIVDRESLRPRRFSTGGSIAMDEGTTMQATITPKLFGYDVNIGNDLLEDGAYDMVQWHITQAAKSIGEYASELALTDLKTATDGWGTVNGGLSGNAAETMWSGAATFGINDTTPARSLISVLGIDGWVPDTLIMTTEAWDHSVKETMLALANNTPIPTTMRQPAPGFHCVLGLPPMDTLFSNSKALHTVNEAYGTALTQCVTICFDRKNALLTGRKRWMQLGNYAHPWDDITGVTITCRQDSVTLYDDAIAVITETS